MALGLTLIYGVLHIVNFAHGSLLMVAMFAAWLLRDRLGIDPYAALPLVTAGMFGAGWLLYRQVIGRVSQNEDRAILLATLGVAVVLDNLALVLFTGDTRTVDTPYSFAMIEAGPLLIAVPKVVSFVVSLLLAGALWAFMARTDTGLAIRAVAREPDGARLMGIRPDRIFALAY
ncbi:MAG: branched-chain amino acid ABC transporter permease, partial [Gemmatimonadaceae bacterium]|nr:branched-chain amino acid ABC transporter permease [Acetobacteraceae bacterium]